MKWQTKKLGDVCDFEGGSQPPKSNFIHTARKGYVRFLQIRDFKSEKNITYIPESKKNRLCNKSDVLIGRYGASVGQILTNEEGAYNVALMKTIPDESVLNKDFFYYYLISHEFQSRLAKVSARSAQAGFSKDDIYNFPVVIPPLIEQKRIIKILYEVFEKTAKVKENAEKNLKNSKELYEVYLQNIFAKPAKDWENKKLGEVCDFYNGKAHEKAIDANGAYIVVNSKFISSNGEKYKKTKKALFPLFKDDIVMVMSDVPNGKALAKCFIVDKNDTYSLNQRICVLRSKVFQTRFLYLQLNRNKYLLDFNNGENQTNLRKADILNCPLFVPSISTQKSIISKLDALSEQTKKLEGVYKQKLADLEELKKSVLNKAFTGKL